MTLNAIAPIGGPAIPFLGHWGSISFAVFAFAVFGATRLLAAGRDEALERVFLTAVRDCLAQAHLPEKVAADLMGLDRSRLQKMLRGEPGQYLPFVAMIYLGLPFWCFFLPHLAFLITKLRVHQMSEDLAGLAEDVRVVIKRVHVR